MNYCDPLQSQNLSNLKVRIFFAKRFELSRVKCSPNLLGKFETLAFPNRTRERFELSRKMSHWKVRIFDRVKLNLRVLGRFDHWKDDVCLRMSNFLDSSNRFREATKKSKYLVVF